MKISQDMKGGTVGALATFLAHALGNGVSLDSPIAMRRDRGSDIVELTIEIALPGFESTQAAANELTGTASGARTRTRPPRQSAGSGAAAGPAETPQTE